MLVARKFTITGRVQRVGFRWFAIEAAEREGVAGWVQNLPGRPRRRPRGRRGGGGGALRARDPQRAGRRRAWTTVETDILAPTGRLPRLFEPRLTEGRAHGDAEGADPLDARLPEAGHPLLRHHDAAVATRVASRRRSTRWPRRTAGRASRWSSASRAAASSSAPPSPTASAPASARSASRASCRRKTISGVVLAGVRHRHDRDSRGRDRAGAAGADRGRRAGDGGHGARGRASGQAPRRPPPRPGVPHRAGRAERPVAARRRSEMLLGAEVH